MEIRDEIYCPTPFLRQVRTPPFQGGYLQHTALSRRCPPIRSYSGLLARIEPEPRPHLIHALGERKTPGHDPVYP